MSGLLSVKPAAWPTAKAVVRAAAIRARFMRVSWKSSGA